jgi:hypothetical protein
MLLIAKLGLRSSSQIEEVPELSSDSGIFYFRQGKTRRAVIPQESLNLWVVDQAFCGIASFFSATPGLLRCLKP